MMALVDLEIEKIVSLVVDRLRDIASVGVTSPQPTSGTGFRQANTLAGASDQTGGNVLNLTGRVISIRDIEDRLSGIRLVRVQDAAVLTPAVKDELSSRQITIERAARLSQPGERELSASTVSRQKSRLQIVAGKNKLSMLQSLIPDCLFLSETPSRTAGDCALELASNWAADQRLIWCSLQPYAAMIAVAALGRHEIRPIGLHQDTDLEAAVDEAMPNLLVLDDRRWSVHQVVRLTNLWTKLLERR